MSGISSQPSSSEDVYPIHALDGIKTHRNYVNWTMRFNDALDAEKLHSALSRLLEIGGWKKLGGRFRYKHDGKLEIYVQTSPRIKQNNICFTHQTVQQNIQDHPVASRLLVATEGPSLQAISKEFRPFVARSSFPTFEEMVEKGLPPLSLHITTFSDATLVALSWPHMLMDVTGGQALLIGWTAIINGREEDVPTVLGAREDILQDPAVQKQNDQSEKLTLENHRLTGHRLLMFKLRFLWDHIRSPPRTQQVIFLPKHALHKIRIQAQKDLVALTRDPGSPPFVSEADILIAWVTRMIALSEPNRPLTMMSLLDARFRILLLRKSGGVYIQNMVLGTYTFLSAHEANKSIGSIALKNREHLTEQATEGQVLSLLRSIFQDIEAGRSPRLIFGEYNSVPIIFNNVTKAELMKKADFSAAILRQGESNNTRKNPLGTMVGYYNESLDGAFDAVNAVLMLGKDHGDNYWLMASLLPRAWAKIEQALKDL